MSANNNKTPMAADVMFIGTSFDPRSKTGVGCKLVMTGEQYVGFAQNKKTRRDFVKTDFNEITASQLELKTIIWAIEQGQKASKHDGLLVCTDSKAIHGLFQKREKLEQTEYASARSGFMVANADLYKEFFHCYDSMGFHVINPMELEDDSPEKSNMLSLLKETQDHAQASLSQQRKEVSTEKFADKWF